MNDCSFVFVFLPVPISILQRKSAQKEKRFMSFKHISSILLISTYVNFILVFCGHLHVLCKCVFQIFVSVVLLSRSVSMIIINITIIIITIIIRNKMKGFSL